MRRANRNHNRWNRTSNVYHLPKRKRSGLVLFSVSVAAAAALTQAYISGMFSGTSFQKLVNVASSPEPLGERIQFTRCHTGGGYNCVVDGDTIWLRGQNIRLADIDTPETHDYGCTSEKQLGERATNRLLEILGSGSVSLEPIARDKDQYGRLLRLVLVNGQSVGETLVEEGLARWYEGGRQPWC